MAQPIAYDIDPKRLYRAVSAAKSRYRLTWPQVARRCRLVSPASLTRLREEGYPRVETLEGILAWLHRPVSDFLREGAL